MPHAVKWWGKEGWGLRFLQIPVSPRSAPGPNRKIIGMGEAPHSPRLRWKADMPKTPLWQSFIAMQDCHWLAFDKKMGISLLPFRCFTVHYLKTHLSNISNTCFAFSTLRFLPSLSLWSYNFFTFPETLCPINISSIPSPSPSELIKVFQK